MKWSFNIGNQRYLPVFQGKGIAKELFKKADAWLKERNAPKIQILIRYDNKLVMDFYKNLGFEVSQSVLMGKTIEYEE